MRIILILIISLNLSVSQEKEYVLNAEESIIKSGDKKSWSSKDYVWVLERDLIIEQGAFLQLQAGTKIKFKANTDLSRGGKDKTKAEVIIMGTLIAEGSSEQNAHITFTSASSSPQSNDWGGIIIYKNKSGTISRFQYCEVSYAYRGISIFGSSPQIKNSQIIYSFNSGIFISSKSKAIIEANNIISNGYAGIEVLIQSEPKIILNYIQQNEFGIMVFDSSKPDIGSSEKLESRNGQNIISDNYQFDLYNSSSNDILAKHNTWISNSNLAEIEKKIFDSKDNLSVGKVIFEPIQVQTFAQLEQKQEILSNEQKKLVSNNYAENKSKQNTKKTTVKNSKTNNTQQNKQQTKTQTVTDNQNENVVTSRNIQTQTQAVTEITKIPEQKADEKDDETIEEVVQENYTEYSQKRPYLSNVLDQGTGLQLSKDATPAYIGAAASQKIKGKVVLRVIIDLDGNVESANVLRSDHILLNDLAIDAAKKNKYAKGLVKGMPVKFELTKIYRF